MKIKHNEKKEMKKIIVHDREPPDSRHMSKIGHFKRKETPKNDENKTKPHQKNKQESCSRSHLGLGCIDRTKRKE
jgi:hypothetical protein